MTLAELLAGVGGQPQQPANQGMAPFLNQWMQQQPGMAGGQPGQVSPQGPQMGMMGAPQSGMNGFGGMGDIAKLLSATGTY